MRVLAALNVDYATIKEMAVSQHRATLAFARRIALRLAGAFRLSVRARWQLGGSILLASIFINMFSMFHFAQVAYAAGETYTWGNRAYIDVKGGRIGTIGPNTDGFSIGSIGGGTYQSAVIDTTGCELKITINKISSDHSKGNVSISTAGPSDYNKPLCSAAIANQYTKGTVSIGNINPVWNFAQEYAGCPGSSQPTAPGDANYNCPNGGVVAGGVYYPDDTSGKIIGTVTRRDTSKNPNWDACHSSTVNVTRISGSFSGDVTTKTDDGGHFSIFVGPGQVTLSTPDCKDKEGNIYTGTSHTLTVATHKVTAGAFEVSTLLANAGDSDNLCDQAEWTELNYWVCAAIKMLSTTTSGLDKAVLGALKIDTDTIFNDSGNKSQTGNAYFAAWSAFRNIAYALLVILALIMIISQILDLDFVSAYTFRKMLPKFFILAIVLGALWNIQDFFYNMSNDAADAIRAIIAAPFSKIDVTIGNTVSNDISLYFLAQALAGAVPAGIAALALLGPGGIAALFLSMVLAVGSAWVLIEGRNVVADMLIIMSPIAVVAAIFGPLKKVYDVWKGLSFTILLSVPSIAGIIQFSHEGAKISYINNHAVVAAIILMAGYALIWGVFKSLDQVAGKIGDVASSATGRLRKGLADYRSNTMKRRTQEAVEGKREVRGARLATGLLRRAHLADQGGFSLSSGGQARYRAAEQHMLRNTVNEMMKRDDGAAGGDDDAMELARQRGMTNERFISEYRQRMLDGGATAAEAQRRAEGALASVRANFGAELGTDALRVAAYKSLLNSKTSYTDPTGANGQQVLDQMYADGAELIADGLMSTTDQVMFMKQRADRADRSGIGFGSALSQAERALTRYQQGARAGHGYDNEVTRAARSTLTAAGVRGLDSQDPVTRAQAMEQVAEMARQAQQWRATNQGPLSAQQQAALDIMDSQIVNINEARELRREALFGTQPGAVVAGRHEAVSALSGVMRDDTVAAANNLRLAQDAAKSAGLTVTGNVSQDADIQRLTAEAAQALQANPNANLTAQQRAALNLSQAHQQHMRNLASIAGRYEVMGQVSPQNATIMANNVMGQTFEDPITGKVITVQQAIEQGGRTDQRFQELRREYATAYMSSAAGQAGAIAGGATPGTIPTPGA